MPLAIVTHWEVFLYLNVSNHRKVTAKIRYKRLQDGPSYRPLTSEEVLLTVISKLEGILSHEKGRRYKSQPRGMMRF